MIQKLASKLKMGLSHKGRHVREGFVTVCHNISLLNPKMSHLNDGYTEWNTRLDFLSLYINRFGPLIIWIHKQTVQ